MNVSIGNDHAGTEYKFKIIEHLNKKGFKITNHGTDSEESVDYPDFIHPVSKDVKNSTSEIGVIICGSGNGASMSANKHQGFARLFVGIKRYANSQENIIMLTS